MKLRVLFFWIFSTIILICYGQTQKGANTLTSSNKSHYKNARALIIGISDYSNLSDDKQLNYADDDALAFYNFLLSRPDFISQENIMMLLNEQASKREYIEGILESFIVDESQDGDLVIVYFSGHAAIQNPDATVDQGYLLLHNAPDDGDYAAPSSDVISVNFLQEIIANVVSGVEVLFIIDACHSGKLINQQANSEKVMIALQNKWEDTYKLASCQSNQSSLEGPQWGNGHGVFTYHLLFGLNGIADIEGNNDNALMFEEIYDYVKGNVKSDTKYKQLPRFEGDGNINFLSVDKEQQKLAMNILSNYTGETSPLLAMTTGKGIDSWYYGIPENAKDIINTFKSLIKDDKLIPQSDGTFPEYRNILATLDLVKESKTYGDHIYKIEFSSNGNFLITYSPSAVSIINSSTQQVENLFDTENLNDIFIHDNNIYLINNNSLEKWEAGGNLITSFNAPLTPALSAISADGKNLAVSDGNSIMILSTNFSDIKNVESLKAVNPEFMFFSSDTTLLVMDSGKKLANIDFKNNNILIERQLSDSPSEIKPITGEDKALLIYSNKLQIINTLWLVTEWESTTVIPEENLSVSATNYPHLFLLQTKNTLGIYNSIFDKNISELDISDNIEMAATAGPYYALLMEAGDIYIAKVRYSGKKRKLPKDENAFEYYMKLTSNHQLEHIHNRIRNDYKTALTGFANRVIEPVVDGDFGAIGSNEIDYALQCMDFAGSINKESEINERQIELTKQLLLVSKDLVDYNYDNYSGALLKLDEIVSVNPDASYGFNTESRIYLRLNELLQAQKSSITAIGNNPYWSEPRISYAKTKIKKKEYKSAIQTLDSVITEFPKARNALLLQGDIYMFLGDMENANKYYNKADALQSDGISKAKLAQVLILQRKYNSAIDILEGSIIEQGPNAYVYLILGKLYFHVYFESLNSLNINSDSFRAAAANLEEANKLNAESPHIRLEYLKMVLTELNGILANEGKTTNQYDQTNPYSQSDYKSRFRNYDRDIAKNKDVILKDLLYQARKLKSKDPYYYPVYKLIADIQVTRGKQKEALAAFDDAISENPEVADLYYIKGQYLMDMRKQIDARPFFLKAIEKDPYFLPAYYSFLKTYTGGSKAKDISTIKDKKVQEILKEAQEKFGTQFFKDSRSINYSKAVPYFFDQVYFY